MMQAQPSMTPTTPKPLTRQEVYDRIIDAVRDHTLPGYNRQTGLCVYNFPSGYPASKHCVIGLFAADMGLQMQEGCGLVDQSEVIIRQLEIYTGVSRHELYVLQEMHDQMAQRVWDGELFILQINEQPMFAKCELTRPKLPANNYFS